MTKYSRIKFGMCPTHQHDVENLVYGERLHWDPVCMCLSSLFYSSSFRYRYRYKKVSLLRVCIILYHLLTAMRLYNYKHSF